MIIDKYPLYFLNNRHNDHELLYVVHENTYSYFGSDGIMNEEHIRYRRDEFRAWMIDLFVQVTPDILNKELMKRFEFPDEVLARIKNLGNEYEEDIEYDD